jgi:hypothetical protein
VLPPDLNAYLGVVSIEVKPYNGYLVQLKWDGNKFKGVDRMMEKHLQVSMKEIESLIKAPGQSLLIN